MFKGCREERTNEHMGWLEPGIMRKLALPQNACEVAGRTSLWSLFQLFLLCKLIALDNAARNSYSQLHLDHRRSK